MKIIRGIFQIIGWLIEHVVLNLIALFIGGYIVYKISFFFVQDEKVALILAAICCLCVIGESISIDVDAERLTNPKYTEKERMKYWLRMRKREKREWERTLRNLKKDEKYR